VKAKDNTTMIIAAVLGVAVIGGGAFLLTRQGKQTQDMNGSEVAAKAEAAAKIAQANAELEAARLAAEVRKAELKALDKPLGDRFLDFGMDAGLEFIKGFTSGSIKF
jgi:hypothetical protein